MNPTDLPIIAIHDIPVSEHLPQASPGVRINFNYYIQPFVDLLSAGSLSFILITAALVEYCQRAVSATQEIFHRITHAPAFRPTHPSFKKLIDQLEDQIIFLQERVTQLEQNFWQTHLISQDMKEMKQLHSEIFQSLRQLNSYVSVLEQRRHPFPIQPQLISVRDGFQDLNDQMNQFCLLHGDKVIEQLQKAFDLFIKPGIDLPKDIHQQLSQAWTDFDEVFNRHLSGYTQAKPFRSKITELRAQAQVLKKTPNQEIQKTDRAEPLKLSNIGNSCYLDSVLQCLFCIDQIREKFNEPIERDPHNLEVYQKKLIIQHEILKFIEAQRQSRENGKSMTQMEFILFLLGGPSLGDLREAIFKSEFHPELTIANGLTDQHDAAYIIELCIEYFLSDLCQFKIRQHATTGAFPGLEFLAGGKEGKDETLSILQVPLRSQKRYQKLNNLIHTLLGKHKEREPKIDDQRKFDPTDGEIVVGQENEAASVINAAPVKVEEYEQWYRMSQLPPVMVMQFKRFTGALKKDNRPVELPEDGILDLTRYYDPPEDADLPKQGRYKIKGMVRHSGASLRVGHYVADVEINGKYFHCNDLDPKSYREVTKKDFLSHRDPYLLFLERLPDEEEDADSYLGQV